MTQEWNPKATEQRLQVRARVRSDLDLLRKMYLPEMTPTIHLPGRDYPYRGYATHEQVAGAMVQAILDIDYDNFKSRVTKNQGGPRHDLYMQVWGVMNNAEAKLAQKEADNRRWAERQASGWFSGGSKTAQRAYDRKFEGQLDFGAAPKKPPATALHPEDLMDPFNEEPSEEELERLGLEDTGRRLGEPNPDSFESLDEAITAAQAMPRPRPRPRKRKKRS